MRVSPRFKEVSLLPDMVADLKSIRSELGISAKSDVDFVLIRDDMVAREVTLSPVIQVEK